MSVIIGELAPDFELIDNNRVPRKLSGYRNRKKVLLVFFPLSFTGICQSELDYLRDNESDYSNDRVELLAITVSPVPSNKVWSSYQGYLFPILADFWPHGQVSKDYGVFVEEEGYAERGTFVIDEKGKVIFQEKHQANQRRDQALWDRVKNALKS